MYLILADGSALVWGAARRLVGRERGVRAPGRFRDGIRFGGHDRDLARRGRGLLVDVDQVVAVHRWTDAQVIARIGDLVASGQVLWLEAPRRRERFHAPSQPETAGTSASAEPTGAPPDAAATAGTRAGRSERPPPPPPPPPPPRPPSSDTPSVGPTVQDAPNKKPDATHWIEIELVGEDDKPIPYEEYRLQLPDGTEVQGRLDRDGFARRDGLEAGLCRLCFSRLDKDAWQFIETRPAREARP